MKYLKWPLLILLALIIIYVLLCVFGPKNMNLSRTVTMKASPAQVFNLYDNLEKWDSWSPWSAMDTSMVKTYGDKKSGLGASYSWKGDPKLTGSGDLVVTESVKNEKNVIKMNFHDFETTSFSHFSVAPKGNETEVTWAMEDEKDFPFLLRGLMLLQGAKGALGKNFDDGMSALKKISEDKAKGIYGGFQIKSVDLDEKHFVMNRQEVKMENVSQFYASSLGSLFGKVQKAGIEKVGKPSGLFFKWNEGESSTDMAAAIGIAEPASIAGASSLTIPEGPALQIDYYGDFAGSANAHYAMDDYLKDYGLLSNVPMIEEYVTDPSEEQDPSKWLTKITYYVSQ